MDIIGKPIKINDIIEMDIIIIIIMIIKIKVFNNSKLAALPFWRSVIN